MPSASVLMFRLEFDLGFGVVSLCPGRRAWFYCLGLRHSLCTLNSCCNSLRQQCACVCACVYVCVALGVKGLAAGPDSRITPLTFRYRHERWSFFRLQDGFHIFTWHLILFSSHPACLSPSLSRLPCSIHQDPSEIGEERSLSYFWVCRSNIIMTPGWNSLLQELVHMTCAVGFLSGSSEFLGSCWLLTGNVSVNIGWLECEFSLSLSCSVYKTIRY